MLKRRRTKPKLDSFTRTTTRKRVKGQMCAMVSPPKKYKITSSKGIHPPVSFGTVSVFSAPTGEPRREGRVGARGRETSVGPFCPSSLLALPPLTASDPRGAAAFCRRKEGGLTILVRRIPPSEREEDEDEDEKAGPTPSSTIRLLGNRLPMRRRGRHCRQPDMYFRKEEPSAETRMNGESVSGVQSS